MSEYQKYRNKKYSKIFIYCVNNEAQVLHNSSCAFKNILLFLLFYLFIFFLEAKNCVHCFILFLPRTMWSAYIKDTASLLVLEMLSLGFTVYSFTSTTMKTQINNSLASKILLE